MGSVVEHDDAGFPIHFERALYFGNASSLNQDIAGSSECRQGVIVATCRPNMANVENRHFAFRGLTGGNEGFVERVCHHLPGAIVCRLKREWSKRIGHDGWSVREEPLPLKKKSQQVK